MEGALNIGQLRLNKLKWALIDNLLSLTPHMEGVLNDGHHEYDLYPNDEQYILDNDLQDFNLSTFTIVDSGNSKWRSFKFKMAAIKFQNGGHSNPKWQWLNFI